MKPTSIRKKLLKNLKYTNDLIVLFESLDSLDAAKKRKAINAIVGIVFEVVDNISSVEIDIYNYLREREGK
jgi:ABC-type iron transport system FetAB ATPase subunit